MRQRTVVRDEKQSFRINIEASDREEVFSLCFINKVNDSLIAPVFRCGNDAAVYLTYNYSLCLPSQPASIQCNPGFVREYFPVRLAADDSIDQNPPFANHLFYLTARSLLHLCQEAV